ncbi:hypothetical protein Bpfe_021724, partial [Biomphalaria pfeifferi]
AKPRVVHYLKDGDMDLTYSSLLMSLCLVYGMAGTVQTDMSTNKTLFNQENSTVDTSIVRDSIILSNSTVTSNSAELSNSIMTSNSTELFNSNATSNSILRLNGNATSNNTLTLNSTVTESTQMPNNVETLSPETIKLKNIALSLIKNNFTSGINCTTILPKILDTQTTVDGACFMLKAAEGSVWESQGCNEKDYKLIKHEMCNDFLGTTISSLKTTQSPEETNNVETLSPETIKLKNIALSLIKNNFTSGINCTTILPKILDTQTTVDGACFMLKAAEGSVWESQGCNEKDYKLIKHEMCNDFLGTTISSLKTTQSPEETNNVETLSPETIKLKNIALSLIKNNFTSGINCTTILPKILDTQTTVDGACFMLKAAEGSVWESQGCNEKDYKLIKHEMCNDFLGTTISSLKTTQSPEETNNVETLSPETIKLKNIALSLIKNNFTSGINCTTILPKILDTQTTVDGACFMLKAAEGSVWESQGCNEKDYKLIKHEMCNDFLGTTISSLKTTQSPEETNNVETLSPETIKLKNIALSLIKNNFTSGINCTTILPKILDTQTTVDGACFMLKAAEGSVWESQGCNEKDYKLIKHEMCNDFLGTTISSLKTTQSPEEIKRHRAIVMCVIDNELSSQECTSTARGQSEGEEDSEKGCEKLKSFASTLSLFHCTDEDYRKLYSVICDKQNYSCSPITSLLKKLTNSCMLTMSAATSELKGDNACRYVESSKRGLLESSTCTGGEYAMIHRLICSADHSLIEAVAEAERIETAELTITTKLTDSCRNVIWPEYKLSNMSQMCQKVNRTGISLVRQSICTREDFDLLKSTLCIVHREYSPEETKLREEIHKLILTLSATCKTTMLDQEKQMQETTVQEACTKLTASREALKSSDICNEEELTKINKLICNGACTLISSWVIALCFSFTISKLFFSL